MKDPTSAPAATTNHGLGLSYIAGLGLLVFGCSLLPGAIVGLLGIVLFFAGIVLTWTAIVRLGGAPAVLGWRLVGGLFLTIGLLGTIPLAYVSAFVISTASNAPSGIEGPSWIQYVWLGAAWVVWPGVICAGVWLRNRPTLSTVLLLWLSLSATFATITGVSRAMSGYLPRSL